MLEVLSKCNETMLSAKRYYKMFANYIEKIARLEVDEDSTTLSESTSFFNKALQQIGLFLQRIQLDFVALRYNFFTNCRAGLRGPQGEIRGTTLSDYSAQLSLSREGP